ncbi:MAG: hypothetical protein MUF18_05990 [Fimbriiglobus sp.]|jgi:hypothetical protein|nr:hypothetical protein [Fimbriiglobus sp.]
MLASVPFAALTFRSWFPWWAAVLLFVLAAGGAVLLYLRESGRVKLGWRLVMAGLRVAIVGLVLFLALRPEWLIESSGNKPKSVAVLIDASESMAAADPRPGTADRWRTAVAFDLVPPNQPIPEMPSAESVPAATPDRPTRFAVAQAALTNPRLDLVKRLAKVGPVEAAAFGATRDGLDPSAPGWLSQLQPDRPRTAIADTVFDLLKRDENQQPAAVVLVSDGRENASGRSLDDLARECVRLGVPVHVYGVGSSSFGQLQIREVLAQDALFVDDTAVVPVRFRGKGFGGRGKVEFKLLLNGREVASETVDAKDGDDQKTTLKFVPTKQDAETAGKQELKVLARYIGDAGEPLADEFAKNVKVVDRKLKVLSVDSQPRWDFKFIQRGLMRDRRCEAKFILTDGDPKAMRSGDPFLPTFPNTRPELFAFDLLILGDIPAGYLTKDQQTWVREFVAEGGGLIQIAGKAAGPSTFAGTPLAEVLPVEFQPQQFKMDPDARTEGFRPQATPAGERSSLLALEDTPAESKRVWAALPPLMWHFPVTKLKPAAETFLVHPTAKLADGKPMPLLAGHYYGKGYVLFAGFDETWRWRRNEADKYFYRFWSQAVYAAGAPRTLGTKLTQLSLDTSDPTAGGTGQVYARLLNSELKPIAVDRITATVNPTDDINAPSQSVTLNGLPGQPGEFVATVPFNKPGRYAMKVENGDDTAVLEYRVTLPADHEQSAGPMNEEGLRLLAVSTGGAFYREEDLHRLPDQVKAKTTPFAEKRVQELWAWNHWWWALLLFLFAAEWTVRKLNSLS